MPKVRPSYAVVVDGETESWYINMLVRNERSINVALKPQVPQKKTIDEQYALVESLAKDFDKVFWVVDLDVVIRESDPRSAKESPLQKLIKYKKKIAAVKNKTGKASNIILILNNPCIEYWYLLHFEATHKFFSDCQGAESQLKKYLPTYEKTKKYYTKQDDDIYLKLRPHLDNARSNAEKITQFTLSDPTVSGVSEMYKMFNELDII